ncbi:hypothetical protein JCM5353_005812 [Sporobolomyces roseus]
MLCNIIGRRCPERLDSNSIRTTPNPSLNIDSLPPYFPQPFNSPLDSGNATYSPSQTCLYHPSQPPALPHSQTILTPPFARPLDLNTLFQHRRKASSATYHPSNLLSRSKPELQSDSTFKTQISFPLIQQTHFALELPLFDPSPLIALGC